MRVVIGVFYFFLLFVCFVLFLGSKPNLSCSGESMGLQLLRLDFGADLLSLKISVEHGPDFPPGIPVKNIV